MDSKVSLALHFSFSLQGLQGVYARSHSTFKTGGCSDLLVQERDRLKEDKSYIKAALSNKVSSSWNQVEHLSMVFERELTEMDSHISNHRFW